MLVVTAVSGLPTWCSGKETPASARDRRRGFRSPGGEDALEKEMQPTPVFLPGKSHGQRGLVGHSPCSCKESDTT